MLNLIKEGLLKNDLYLQGGLYFEVAFNTVLSVDIKRLLSITLNIVQSCDDYIFEVKV